MINSIIGKMAGAEKLSVAQLQQAIKDGTIPAYVGIPMLQDKMKQAQQAQVAGAMGAPKQPPVAQQIMQAASQHEGIDHLPSNLPAEGMAGGGIVAFDDGGEVEHFAVGSKDAVDYSRYYSDPTRFSHAGISPDDEAYDAALAGSSVGNAGIDVMKWAVPSYPLYRGIKWLTGQRLIADPNNPGKVIKAGQLPETQAPDDTAAQRDAFVAQQVGRQGQQAGIDNPNVRPASADKAGIQALAGTDNQTNPLLSALQTQEAAEAANKNAPASTPDSSALDAWSKKLAATGTGASPVKWTDIKGNAADWEALKKPTRTYEDYAQEYEQRVGKNEGLEERKSHLGKMEEALKGEMETSPWLALMKAGIGAMKGTSQYALTNIGAGAEEGLNDYIKSQDKISAKKEKLYDAQTALADAVRQEKIAKFNYGDNSKKAEEAHNNTIAMHKIADDHAIQLENKKGAFEASKTNAQIASDDARARMSAGVQLAIAKADNDMKRYVADLTATDNMSTKMAAAYHNASQDALAELKAIIGDKGIDPMGMGIVKSEAEGTALFNRLLLKHQQANGLPPRLPPGASTGASITGKIQPDAKTGEFNYIRNQ